MPGPITTFAELTDALAALRPPAPGHTRVFRGQIRDYPTMTPTGIRNPDSDAIWPIYSAILSQAIRDERSDAVAVGDLDLWLLWVQAIKQHYGPGSAFLDVTHSPGIAAWFALHRMEHSDVQAVYGPPGPFDPRTDVFGRHDFARYVRFEETPGYLYAFDAITGAAATDLEHGVLFDLALAPPEFSASTRIQAQRACLIYADSRVDGGDLSKFLVPGTPLEIAWPLDKCLEVGWSTNDVFPPVGADEWYARFVAVPLTPDLGESKDATVYDHPISVTMYMPHGSGEQADRGLLEDLSGRLVTLQPPLLYGGMLHRDDLRNRLPPHPLSERFEQATAVLLEGPLLTALPPIASDFLNLGVLASSLSDAAPVREFGSREVSGGVDLRNVFVELSGLDTAGWERAEQVGGEMEVPRAVWIVREGESFFATLFVDRFPSGGYAAGPVEIVYDRGTRSFAMRGAAQEEWRPLLQVEFLAELFLKSLALVRSLSPGWKVSPFTSMQTQAEGQVTSIVQIEWAIGDVVGLQALSGPIQAYHMLREWGTDDPFFGRVRLSSPAVGGALKLEGQPYGQMDSDQVLEAARPQLDALGVTPPQLPSG